MSSGTGSNSKGERDGCLPEVPLGDQGPGSAAYGSFALPLGPAGGRGSPTPSEHSLDRRLTSNESFCEAVPDCFGRTFAIAEGTAGPGRHRSSPVPGALGNESFFETAPEFFGQSFVVAEGGTGSRHPRPSPQPPSPVARGLLDKTDEDEWAQYCTYEGLRDVDLRRAVAYLRDCTEERSVPWRIETLEWHTLYYHRWVRAFRNAVFFANLVYGLSDSAVPTPGPVASDSVDVALALLFLADIGLQVWIMGWHLFCRSRWRLIQMSAAVLFAFTAVVHAPWLVLLRLLSRPTVSLVQYDSLRSLLPNLFSTGQRLVVVLALVVGVLLVASVFAFICFAEDNPHFQTIPMSMYSLAVCMTTVNFPDVMLPSYHRTRHVQKYISEPAMVNGHLQYQVTFNISSPTEHRFTWDAAGLALLAGLPLLLLPALGYLVYWLTWKEFHH